ncbi:hypothetical protein [Streptomyces sp. NPDC048106]|uniref:hypothetical protein n=1 Tax=Streptomyces sp. NPDC048106 TaxID=3155750 RepID=UPI003452A7B4
MGMKDQQHQGQGQRQGKDKLGQSRERTGQQPGQSQQRQPGQSGQGQRSSQQPNRGRQDIDDTEAQDRLDHDYDV